MINQLNEGEMQYALKYFTRLFSIGVLFSVVPPPTSWFFTGPIRARETYKHIKKRKEEGRAPLYGWPSLLLAASPIPGVYTFLHPLTRDKQLARIMLGYYLKKSIKRIYSKKNQRT